MIWHDNMLSNCAYYLLPALQMKGSTDMSVLVVSHEELASALRIRSAGALPGQTMQKSKFTSKSFCIPSYKEDPESLKASAEGFSDPVSYPSSWRGQHCLSCRSLTF